MPQCPTCGSSVSEQAEVCPDCGMDLKEAAHLSPTPAPESETVPAPVSPAPSSMPEAEPLPTIPPADASLAPPATPDSSPSLPDLAPLETDLSPIPPVVPSPPAEGGMSRITLKRSGTLTSETFALGGRVVVGRFDPESGPVDVDLGPLPEAAYISRHHAEIWKDDSGQWLLKDLGSRNGSFVRGPGQAQFLRVTGDQPLHDGDEIALGNARFEFRLG